MLHELNHMLSWRRIPISLQAEDTKCEFTVKQEVGLVLFLFIQNFPIYRKVLFCKLLNFELLVSSCAVFCSFAYWEFTAKQEVRSIYSSFSQFSNSFLKIKIISFSFQGLARGHVRRYSRTLAFSAIFQPFPVVKCIHLQTVYKSLINWHFDIHHLQRMINLL